MYFINNLSTAFPQYALKIWIRLDEIVSNKENNAVELVRPSRVWRNASMWLDTVINTSGTPLSFR